MGSVTKREKAKRNAVKAARKKVSSLLAEAMTRKSIDADALNDLCEMAEGKAFWLARKPPIATLAKMFFELGYELAITTVPLNRERLKELSKR